MDEMSRGNTQKSDARSEDSSGPSLAGRGLLLSFIGALVAGLSCFGGIFLYWPPWRDSEGFSIAMVFLPVCIVVGAFAGAVVVPVLWLPVFRRRSASALAFTAGLIVFSVSFGTVILVLWVLGGFRGLNVTFADLAFPGAVFCVTALAIALVAWFVRRRELGPRAKAGRRG